MLNSGYSLSQLELLNWGNFHGLQKISFREIAEYGPLFAPPPAAAILGVNGSGKSTLIDGLMMALLPFENSLKLGVTNDSEVGGSGGRTVRDYVLGKFSSTGENTTLSDPKSVFGRKDGCSIFLISFIHNKVPDRIITMGRIWWYQNFKVSETHLAFMNYGKLSISDLCRDNQVPKSAKFFKEFVKEQLPSVQLFETMQSYFMSLSNALGGITKEDLKILNRAFYVKSISQIDHFIRDNMLLEQESPHLERLLENVRNGQEIAFAIETCNQKIELIQKILKGLSRLKSMREKKSDCEQKRRLLILFTEWTELKKNLSQLNETVTQIKELTLKIPELESLINEQQKELSSLQAQIAHSDVTFRLQQIESDIQSLEEKIKLYKILKQTFTTKFSQVKTYLNAVFSKNDQLKAPNESTQWHSFVDSCVLMLEKIEKKSNELSTKIEIARKQKFEIDQESSSVKSELEHLSQVKSLIPRELYEIKMQAITELKIPEANLYFVGELIQIKAEYLDSRKAIEAVLFPISRNLVCHPQYLNILTNWLDNKGLRSDIVVKRIKEEELSGFPETLNFDADKILGRIEVLPLHKQNPFYYYIWQWLKEVFDFRLVEVGQFKRGDGRLVTLNGLVKSDLRTMRKLKQNFSYSLGWDNTTLIKELTQRLVQLQADFQKTSSALEIYSRELQQIEESKLLLNQFKSETHIEFLNLDHFILTQESKKQQKTNLLKENPNFHILKDQAENLNKQLNLSLRQLSTLEEKIKLAQNLEKKLSNLVPIQETNLKSSLLYHQLLQKFSSQANLLEEALVELEQTLTEKNSTRVTYETELDETMRELEIQINKNVATCTVELGQYKRNFNDANLPYDLSGINDADLMTQFYSEWQNNELRLRQTELPEVQGRWRRFFDQILMDSVKDTINEIKAKLYEIENSIVSINEVLKMTNFEDLPTEKRYLQINIQTSQDERIRKFRRQMQEVEKLLGPQIRTNVETQSDYIIQTLLPFVDGLQKDLNYRNYVTDVRHHFIFKVNSLRRGIGGEDDLIVETFTGSRNDAKSSAQTTQLAYTLLASCLAYRFKFHDPVYGQDTPRLLILDEFGGKFDNEKPKDILRLLARMGFQSLLVSPMSKADLLADNINQLILVYKVSASHSKTQSHTIFSRADYDQLLESAKIKIDQTVSSGLQ